jgi:hypothetical protein
MTEAEWLAATFALLLMEAADRGLVEEEGATTWRSVAARVACLERLGAAIPEGVRRWLSSATAYLDEEDRHAPSDGVLFRSEDGVYDAFRQAYLRAGPELRQRLAAAQDVFRGSDYYACEEYMLEEDETSPTYTGPVYVAESAAHCDIIRDIFGNPFRPATLDPSWLTSTVTALARQMYESRDFSAMPILADALQDAGCSDEAILSHLRGPGPHVRGCWVVDLLLGKG